MSNCVIPTLDYTEKRFIYGHAEAFVENDGLRTLLRLSFKERVKAVVRAILY